MAGIIRLQEGIFQIKRRIQNSLGCTYGLQNIQTVTSQWLYNYYKERLVVHKKSNLLLKITFSTDLQLQLITLDTNKDNWEYWIESAKLDQLSLENKV